VCRAGPAYVVAVPDDIRYEVADRTATITLHRPDRLNAFTLEMTAHYGEALAEAELDPRVRVIVVTGAGRAFSAGADFAALAEIRRSGGLTVAGNAREAPVGPWSTRPGGTLAYTMAAALTKPVIAAVNGPAAGVGFVTALSADLRWAAPGAKLVTSYARLGLPAEYGVAWLLPRLVGHGRAVDLLFSARALPAEDAQAIGLVNRLVAPERLLDDALDYAGRLAAEMSPRSLAAMKAQLAAAPEQGFAGAITDAVRRMEEMTRQPDFAEGVAAATAKRAPVFPD
jgi:enoyl-CoA hydratase/carnithine racemase